MRFRRTTVALAVLALVATSCGKAEHVAAPAEAPFSDLTYEQALERAREQGRVLLLDFTASWCPPCRAMEESTWPDSDVQDWIAREAVAIQVDVDREGELSASMRVSSIPTIVFLDTKGTELGRFTGYKDPAQFLAEAAKHVD
ncbi:MAG TPA: thioredoxin family protein [Planctomycetota bacterium]|nr:thioredoxin family protein [Planctomycetota bacterium]